MSPRDHVMPADDEPLEQFTDLAGNPDKPEPADAAILDDLSKPGAGANKTDIPDADLEVDDTPVEDPAAGADGDDTENPDDPGEVEEEDQPAAGSDFDPKDVVILTKDAQLLESQKARAGDDKTRAEADLAAAEAEMLTAKEAGDSKADVAASKKFAAATVALQTATNDLNLIARAENGLKQRAIDLYNRAPKDAEGKPILDGNATRAAAKSKEIENRPSKLVGKFKTANAWFGNTKYKAQAARLLQIDKGLAAEGVLSKDDPKYFEELGRRFNREHPGLYKNLDGKPVATGARRPGTGAPIPGAGGGGGGGGGAQEGAGSKVKLTSDDLGQMRRFGMDPDNLAHRREWLTNKRALASQPQRGGRAA